MTGEEPEDELAARQDPRLYPVGRALRSSYDAENHDSLDPVVMGLMLDLARVEPGPAVRHVEAEPLLGETARHGEVTLLGRLLGLLSRRGSPGH
jgi:hypothetical protein